MNESMDTVSTRMFGSRVYSKNPDVISRVILGETILVPICGRLADMQNIFALEAVGAFIWSCVDGKSNLAVIHEQIQKEFRVEAGLARADLVEFIDQLVNAELVTLSGS